MWRRISSVVMLVCLTVSPVSAQGQQSGAVGGRVSSADRLPLPGVTVTVSSAALQGERTAITDINGIYSLPGLPPGHYVIRFELDNMSSVERRADVPLGGAVVVDQELALAPVNEVVEVHGVVPAPVSSRGGVNIRATEIAVLPIGRTPFLVAELAPGLTDNTPNAMQVTISGAFAYDNLFLMNGVDINDNVLGTPNNLFIEDAIQEVQVLTSGISAEYGRFSGGIINVITRSGGNMFSGAFRTNFTNPAWSVETPFEKSAGHLAREQALADLRSDGRRPDRARSPVVLRRRSRGADDHAELVRPDADSVHHVERQHALRSEADRHDRARSHAAGQLHRQPDRPAPAVDRRGHRSGDHHHAVHAESDRVGDLARGARTPHVRRRRSTRRRTGSCRTPAAPARRSSTRRS